MPVSSAIGNSSVILKQLMFTRSFSSSEQIFKYVFSPNERRSCEADVEEQDISRNQSNSKDRVFK